MTNIKKLDILKKALVVFKNEAKDWVSEFKAEHPNKTSAMDDKDCLLLMGTLWIAEETEKLVKPNKDKTHASDIIDDKGFMTSLIAQISKAEGKEFKLWSDIIDYIYTEVPSDKEMNKKLNNIANILNKHASLRAIVDGKMILPPDEVAIRMENLKELEDHYDTMSDFYSLAFEEASDELKCCFCKASKKMNANAVFAFCLHKALQKIYTPVEKDGQYYCMWIDDTDESKE